MMPSCCEGSLGHDSKKKDMSLVNLCPAIHYKYVLFGGQFHLIPLSAYPIAIKITVLVIH